MYLRVDENFASHPKTIAFVGRMQDPNAAMYLIKLWTWAVRSCPDGDLTGMLPWSIEDVVGYRLQDGRCYAAMVASGFIDERATGEPAAIHKWMERTGGDVVQMEKEADRKRAWRLHRSRKCEQARCVHCRDKSEEQETDDMGMSASPDRDKPETSASRPPDDPHQGKARQGKSGSGSSLSLPSRSSPPDQTRSNASANIGAFRERPRVVVGACTPAFLAVFDRYPRKDAKQDAAQVFQEVAADYPGGEEALSAAILAAFDAGFLKRHPYNGPNHTRPFLDKVLARRRWEDPESAPDWAGPSAAERERSPTPPKLVGSPRPKFIPPSELSQEKPSDAAIG